MANPENELLKIARARFSDLTDPEIEVISQAAMGEWANFGDGEVPADAGARDEMPKVRAGVLEWLAADNIATAHVHHRGIRIAGAIFEEPLDLSDANLPHPLRLIKCAIPDPIDLGAATTRTISLSGSRIGALAASGSRIEGNLFLNNGFHAEGEVILIGSAVEGQLICNRGTFANEPTALVADGIRVREGVYLIDHFSAHGEVRFHGAEIGSHLDCHGGTFSNRDGIALNAEATHIRGAALLRDGFSAHGEVTLNGAEIGSHLDCQGGTFSNRNGIALTASAARVRGTVFLRTKFAAQGEVNFTGAEIGGDLDCQGGKFEAQSGDALTINGARVGQTLDLSFAEAPVGTVDLRNSSANTLLDDPASWPSELHLDGFTYRHIGLDKPRDAKLWLKWLELQPDDRRRIQPYAQLAAVLREMGHEEASRRIAITKQRVLRGRLGWWPKLWSYFLDGAIGFGYRPWYAVGWLALVWLVGSLILWNFSTGAMCPTEFDFHIGGQCQAPDTYPGFQPVLYALDALVPFLDLHQDKYWEFSPRHPWSAWLSVWQWVHVSVGWLLSVLAAVGFSGILRKD